MRDRNREYNREYNRDRKRDRNGEHSHSGRHGRQREDGKRGGRGGGRFSIPSLLDGKPNAMLLFIGAVGCTRHRGFQMGELMREGRMALLCPTATDFATGRYLHQIVDAMVELKEERNVSEFVVMYGCQCALLSTDFELIQQELKEHDITITVNDRCHLCRTDTDDDDDDEPKGVEQE